MVFDKDPNTDDVLVHVSAMPADGVIYPRPPSQTRDVGACLIEQLSGFGKSPLMDQSFRFQL